jgi:hypothetical protein
MLRDGLVIANLKSGSPPRAREALDQLRRFSARPPQSLRTLLLDAYAHMPAGGPD